MPNAGLSGLRYSYERDPWKSRLFQLLRPHTCAGSWLLSHRAPHCLSVALSMSKEGFMCWCWANHTIKAYPCYSYRYIFIYFAGLGIKSRALQMLIKYLATELSSPQPAGSTQNHCIFLSAIYSEQWQAKVTNTLKAISLPTKVVEFFK